MDAISQFRNGLNHIVDRLSFITQCYMNYEHGSFALYQVAPFQWHFLFRHIFFIKAVGLPLERCEEECFVAIRNFDPPGDVFGYLREAANASTKTTRFTMLVGALEALAGE